MVFNLFLVEQAYGFPFLSFPNKGGEDPFYRERETLSFLLLDFRVRSPKMDP